MVEGGLRLTRRPDRYTSDSTGWQVCKGHIPAEFEARQPAHRHQVGRRLRVRYIHYMHCVRCVRHMRYTRHQVGRRLHGAAVPCSRPVAVQRHATRHLPSGAAHCGATPRHAPLAFRYDSTDMAAIWYRLFELKADWVVYVTDAGQGPHLCAPLALAPPSSLVGGATASPRF